MRASGGLPFVAIARERALVEVEPTGDPAFDERVAVFGPPATLGYLTAETRELLGVFVALGGSVHAGRVQLPADASAELTSRLADWLAGLPTGSGHSGLVGMAFHDPLPAVRDRAAAVYDALGLPPTERWQARIEWARANGELLDAVAEAVKTAPDSVADWALGVAIEEADATAAETLAAARFYGASPKLLTGQLKRIMAKPKDIGDLLLAMALDCGVTLDRLIALDGSFGPLTQGWMIDRVREGSSSRERAELLSGLIAMAARIPDPRLEPLVAEQLASEDFWTRRRAIQALAHVGTGASVPALQKLSSGFFVDGEIKRDCEASIAAIRKRGTSTPGALSVAEVAPQDGALSLERSGQLSPVDD